MSVSLRRSASDATGPRHFLDLRDFDAPTLRQMLDVAAHYKNTPNDLQLMSDAPAHQLYVLVPPVDESAKRPPEPLCVIQVVLEGQISSESVMASLSRGQRAGGERDQAGAPDG